MIGAKYVYEDKGTFWNGKIKVKKYRGEFKHKNTIYRCGAFETIKQAQIAVDVKRLELGLNPIILKQIGCDH